MNKVEAFQDRGFQRRNGAQTSCRHSTSAMTYVALMKNEAQAKKLRNWGMGGAGSGGGTKLEDSGDHAYLI